MSRRMSAALMGIVLVAALAGLLARSVDRRLEHSTINWRYAIRGTQAVPQDIELVKLDSYTGQRLNVRQPTRFQEARVVRNLTRAGARVIAWDFTLAYVSLQDGPEGDAAIVSALDQAKHAIVSVTDLTSAGKPQKLAGKVPFSDTSILPANSSRLTRRAGTWIRFADDTKPLGSFPLLAARAFRPSADLKLPDRALIDYRGPSGTFPSLSYVKVLNGKFDPSAVAGKIVVVGPAAPDLQDLHDVPIGDRMYGLEIHANAIATALDDFPLSTVSSRTSSLTTIGGALLVPLLMLGLTLVLRRRRKGPPGPLLILGLGGGAAGLWLVVSQLLFNGGIVVDLTPPLAAIIVATALVYIVALRTERRNYRDLRRRFAEGDKEYVADVLESDDKIDERVRMELVPGYTIESLVEEGGMGAVYRGTDNQLGRSVAIKVISDKYARNTLYRDRFLQEAQIAASVHHPNALDVYALGESGEQLFIAMPWIDGFDLAGYLAQRGGSLPPLESAELIHRVARAVDAMAARGVVHCDIKPRNILLDRQDLEHPYLSDFGIARGVGTVAAGEDWPFTPTYMAPEQYRNEISPSIDIYALAGVFVRCVSGHPPFPSPVAGETQWAHANDPRPKVSTRVAGLPVAIDDLIAQAMAIQPADRPFASATAFSEALLDVVRGMPAQPEPPVGAGEPIERTETL